MSGFYITLRDFPAWYELAATGESIEIRVHSLALDSAKERLVASRFRDPPSELQLPPFIELTEDSWGFGKVISFVSREDGWTTFRCPLPIIFRKKSPDPDWPSAYVVCATLQVLFSALNGFEEQTNSPNRQLLTITAVGMLVGRSGGWGLDVKMSPTLCSWLAKKAGSSEMRPIEEVADIMKKAHQHMYRQGDFPVGEHSFMAYVRTPKALHLACPGNACGLDPEDFGGSPEKGYELTPHNMDGPLQQLTLLSGVAAVYDLARKEGA